jgi:hypothetical protein
MKRYLVATLFIGTAAFAPRAAAADEKGWSTIKGQVVWAVGAIPQRQAVNVNKDKDHCLSKGPLLSEEWVINPKNKGVRWTIVWLAPNPGPGQAPLPVHPSLKTIKAKEVVIDQPCCAFEPHVLAMREGQDLLVKNSAPVPHNVNWTGYPRTNPGGNVLIPAGGSYTITGLKADKLPLIVKCNIHPWMLARLAVLDHPYFAVTDENGNFQIPKAQDGQYRLKVYHESIGWLGGAKGRDGQPITIKDGAVTDLGKIDLKPNR